MTVYPELAVLALDLPDSDGEATENERERTLGRHLQT
jgi:hypothetical protein